MTTNINVIADSIGAVGGAVGTAVGLAASSAVGGAGSTLAVGGAGSTLAVGGAGSMGGTHAAGGAGNTQAVGNTIEAPKAVPGWPASWPPPRVQPRPFEPLCFVLSSDQLIRAVAACTPEQLRACRRGDPGATAQLLMEVVRQVHTDPLERNVYLNPRRSDLALVSSPVSWNERALARTGGDLFDRIAQELANAGAGVPPDVKAAMKAVRENYGSQPARVTASSLSSLSAHLENVRRQTASGEDWLGTPVASRGSQVRYLGAERCWHVSDADPSYVGLASMMGVYSVEDITPDNAYSLAVQAVVNYARLMLNGHQENLCLLPGPPGQVYVNTREGWVLRPREEVSLEQADQMRMRVFDDLRVAEETILRGLMPTLLDRRDDLLRELGRPDGPVITRYLSAAEHYYMNLPRTDAPSSDERYLAQALLLGISSGATIPVLALVLETAPAPIPLPSALPATPTPLPSATPAPLPSAAPAPLPSAAPAPLPSAHPDTPAPLTSATLAPPTSALPTPLAPTAGPAVIEAPEGAQTLSDAWPGPLSEKDLEELLGF